MGRGKMGSVDGYPQLIGWRLRATRHAWRTIKKGLNRIG